MPRRRGLTMQPIRKKARSWFLIYSMLKDKMGGFENNIHGESINKTSSFLERTKNLSSKSMMQAEHE